MNNDKFKFYYKSSGQKTNERKKERNGTGITTIP